MTDQIAWQSVASSQPQPSLLDSRRPTPRWLRRYTTAVVLIDVASAAVAGVAAFGIRFGDVTHPKTSYLLASLLLPVLWVVFVALGRGYETMHLGSGSEEFRHVLRAGTACLAVVGFVSYALTLEIARGYVVIALPLTAWGSLVGRYAARKMLHRLRRTSGRCIKTVVAVGRERAVLDLVLQMRQERHCGMEVIAACVPHPENAEMLRATNVEVSGDLTQAAEVIRRLNADAVAVTSSSETSAVYLRRLSWELEGSGVELLVAPGLMEVAGPRMHMRPFVGLPLLHVEEPEFTGGRRLVKGLLDRSFAGLALVALVLPCLVVALAIRLDSAGPVFFRQVRVGRHGRSFSLLKFRTMVSDAEDRLGDLVGANVNGDGLLFKIRDDPRITRVGRLLRRYSVDELPQLINVLLGQMSLVGPRPPLPSEVALYDDSVRRRLLVKPGLTGLWQVSGRSDLTWDESVRLDLRYVENWSLSLDVLIMWKTTYAVLRSSGAY